MWTVRKRLRLLFLLQITGIIMGSMLVIFFVQRQCEDGIYTLQQNIQNSNGNRAALVTNLVSILSFLATYIVELRRENFCVHNNLCFFW